jgi:hypothetical protein
VQPPAPFDAPIARRRARSDLVLVPLPILTAKQEEERWQQSKGGGSRKSRRKKEIKKGVCGCDTGRKEEDIHSDRKVSSEPKTRNGKRIRVVFVIRNDESKRYDFSRRNFKRQKSRKEIMPKE